MRTISSNAQTEISKQYGLESLNIVRVWWNDVPYDYGDKTNLDYGIDGKLLELSGIEDVLLLSGTTTTNVTVKLDDSEGTIKDILNYNDIHKKRVQILQWFEGRPKEDAFVLFDGQINTPIDWNEGDRTFTFSVVNLIENQELGFSFEDGLFPGIPSNLIGKAWPIVFGNVLKVPALQLTESPTGVLGEGFAIVYDSVYQAEIENLSALIAQANDLSRQYYLAHIDIQRVGATYNNDSKTVSETIIGEPDNIDTYNQYLSQAAAALQQSYNYGAEVRNLSHQRALVIADYEEKSKYVRTQVDIASVNFPRGIDLIAEINGTRFDVRFEGQQMIIHGEVTQANLPGSVYVSESQETDILRTHTVTKQAEKFKWFDGGSRINIINQPIYYIAAFGVVNITGVFARTRGIMTRIPENYYGISYAAFTNDLGITAKCTVVHFNIPLTSVKDATGTNIWEGDSIWCDIIGEVAGNYEAIVRYAANTFTDLAINEISLITVGAQTDTQPMNFMIDSRVGTLDFLKDLSFQARVSIWVNDRTLYFRYLPIEPTPTNTITMNDIVEDSLVITCNTTESLVTKLVGQWKYDYSQPESNRVIVRTNILKYGLKDQVVDYFAYNHVDLVQLSVVFWSIRMGNSWKLLKFKTFMDKLSIEANDPITVILGLAAQVPVTGIVERAVYDSSTNLIDMEVWLPVRWGEMLPYTWAYPANVQVLYGKPDDIEAQTGNPFKDVQDNGFAAAAQAAMSVQISKYNPFRDSSHFPGYATNDPGIAPTDPFTAAIAFTNAAVNFDRPLGIAQANDKKIFILKDDAGLPDIVDLSPIVDIGIVISQVSGKDYIVEIVPTPERDPPLPTKPSKTTIDLGTIKKRDTGPKRITATQLLIHEDYIIPAGTPVVVVRKGNKYYMQAPVWAGE